MGDLRLYDLSGSATGGQLRILKLSGTLTAAAQLRVLKVSGSITYSTTIASAGVDRFDLTPGAVVTLDGSASEGSTFQWTCVSYGTSGAPSITNATSKVATYVAPSEFDDVNLVFRLTVDETATDNVTHQVDPQIEWTRTGSTWVPLNYGATT